MMPTGFTHLRGLNHFNDLRAPTTENLGGSQDVAIVENKGFFLMGKVPQMRCVHTVVHDAETGSHLAARIDRLADRLERIEHRLDPVDG